MAIGLVAVVAISAVANLGNAGRGLFSAVGNRLTNSSIVAANGGLASCAGGSSGGYTFGLLNNGATATVTRQVAVTNGNQTYSATASCNNGAVTISGEAAGAISCTSPYVLSGGSCVSPDCAAQTVSGYSVGALTNGATAAVSKSVAVSNGSQTYNATATCSSTVTSISGETPGAISCNSGYTLSSGTCVAATYASCRAIINAGAGSTNGLYMIDPDGAGSGAAMQVYCDMTGGGWTLIMSDPGTGCDVPLASSGAYGWQGSALVNNATTNCGILALTYAQSKGLSLTNEGLVYSSLGNVAAAVSYLDAYNRLYFNGLGGIEYGNPGFASGTKINSWVSPNGVNSGIGCPMLNNMSAAESSSYGQNMSVGTAGTGDTNSHNGGGCWGVPSTGPTSGSLWVR